MECRHLFSSALSQTSQTSLNTQTHSVSRILASFPGCWVGFSSQKKCPINLKRAHWNSAKRKKSSCLLVELSIFFQPVISKPSPAPLALRHQVEVKPSKETEGGKDRSANPKFWWNKKKREIQGESWACYIASSSDIWQKSILTHVKTNTQPLTRAEYIWSQTVPERSAGETCQKICTRHHTAPCMQIFPGHVSVLTNLKTQQLNTTCREWFISYNLRHVCCQKLLVICICTNPGCNNGFHKIEVTPFNWNKK